MARIYTRTGDNGTTGMTGGRRVSKASAQAKIVGELDELNSSLGIIVCKMKDEYMFQDVVGHITTMQCRLFELGALVAQNPELDVVDDEDKFKANIASMESTIDGFEDMVPKLKNFILPGGSELACYLHHSRCIARRCERTVVEYGTGRLFKQLTVYLNRLSDMLFVMARLANHIWNVEDVIWHG